jgi:hypothetical protein
VDKEAKRVKQLLEYGHYPLDDYEETAETAVCPECDTTWSVWDMCYGHVEGTPRDELVHICDECYYNLAKYDSRTLTIHTKQ